MQFVKCVRSFCKKNETCFFSLRMGVELFFILFAIVFVHDSLQCSLFSRSFVCVAMTLTLRQLAKYCVVPIEQGQAFNLYFVQDVLPGLQWSDTDDAFQPIQKARDLLIAPRHEQSTWIIAYESYYFQVKDQLRVQKDNVAATHVWNEYDQCEEVLLFTSEPAEK